MISLTITDKRFEEIVRANVTPYVRRRVAKMLGHAFDLIKDQNEPALRHADNTEEPLLAGNALEAAVCMASWKESQQVFKEGSEIGKIVEDSVAAVPAAKA